MIFGRVYYRCNYGSFWKFFQYEVELYIMGETHWGKTSLGVMIPKSLRSRWFPGIHQTTPHENWSRRSRMGSSPYRKPASFSHMIILHPRTLHLDFSMSLVSGTECFPMWWWIRPWVGNGTKSTKPWDSSMHACAHMCTDTCIYTCMYVCVIVCDQV